MAAVTPVTLPGFYVLIAHFQGAAGPDATWRSEFTLKDTAEAPDPNSTIVTACVAYWIANLRHDCTLEHIELRNWSKGDQPYVSQSALWTAQIGELGDKITTYGAESADAMGKEVACYIRLGNFGPRPGKQFLRQLLDAGDIAAVPGSPWQFLTAPQVPNVTPAKFATMLTNTGLIAFVGNQDPGLAVVHYSAKEAAEGGAGAGPFGTNVQEVSIIGPTVNKATRKRG